MAKWLKVAGLAVVALLVAASASGDSNTYNYQGTGPYFNTKSGQVVDATGNAKVVDADRDRDLVMGQNSIINSTITALSADSSIAFPIGNAKTVTVWLKIIPAAATTTSRVAVQFRLHLSSSSDSNSVAPWTPRHRMAALNAGSGPDSLGDVAALATNTGYPYTDELLVVRSTLRTGAASGGTPGAFNWNSLVPLTFNIAPGSASYFSVRVRNCGGSSIKVIAHYRASSL